MKSVDAVVALSRYSSNGIRLFTANDLGKALNEGGEKLRSTIKRLLATNALVRIARNLYYFSLETPASFRAVEHIAATLRRGEYVFESLESAASKWGVISQIPIDRITVMTTGNSGEVRTPFGVIEFTHTAATPQEILANTIEQPNSPLRIATKHYTVHNLLRCGSNTHLIDWGEVDSDDI